MLVVSASSVIFVVVIAIWATYLLFYVTRRREHLATARSVDRFSAHMRVLQRRGSRAAASPSAHTSSGTLVGAVKATAPYDVQADVALEPVGTAVGRPAARSCPPPRSEMPVSGTPRQVAAVGINRGFALLGRVTSVPAATVRRYVLRTAAGTLLVTLIGAVAGILGWWLFAVSLLGFVGAMAWSRSAATAARAAFERRAAVLRQARGPGDEAAAYVASAARPRAFAMPVRREHAVQEPTNAFSGGGYDGDSHDRYDFDFVPAVHGASVGDGPGREERRTVRDEVFDFAQVQGEHGARATMVATAARVEPGRGGDGLDPLGAIAGWAPVPVPAPTYTLKARAQRPLPAPTPQLDVPVPIEIDDEFDRWQRDTHGGQAAVNG